MKALRQEPLVNEPSWDDVKGKTPSDILHEVEGAVNTPMPISPEMQVSFMIADLFG
jgi:hypothetical protein